MVKRKRPAPAKADGESPNNTTAKRRHDSYDIILRRRADDDASRCESTSAVGAKEFYQVISDDDLKLTGGRGQVTGIRSLGGAVVDVLVGPNAVRFVVHEGLLCARAELFRRIFRGRTEFQERDSLRVHLAEEDPKIFEMFLHFLYQDPATDLELVFKTHRYAIIPDVPTLLEMAHLWLFGDFVQCSELCARVAEYVNDRGFLRALKNIPSAADISWMYESLPEQPWRTVLAKLFLQNSGFSYKEQVVEMNDYPGVFALELLKQQYSSHLRALARRDTVIRNLENALAVYGYKKPDGWNYFEDSD